MLVMSSLDSSGGRPSVVTPRTSVVKPQEWGAAGDYSQQLTTNTQLMTEKEREITGRINRIQSFIRVEE